MGSLAYNINALAGQDGALPTLIQLAAAEVLRAAEAAGFHVPAVSWFNPASTPEHHVPGFRNNGGVAVDFMIIIGGKADTKLQDFIDAYVWKHRVRLGVCWLISRRRIRSTSPGHDGNWHPYSGPSPHTDHSHVNFGHLAGTNGSNRVTKITYKPLAGETTPTPPAEPKGYPEPKSTVVYADKIAIGQKDSDSVYLTQKALGRPTTGDWTAADQVALLTHLFKTANPAITIEAKA